MEIGASNNAAALAQTANESRQLQNQTSRPAPQTETLENTTETSTSASNTVSADQRVGGRIDTFA